MFFVALPMSRKSLSSLSKCWFIYALSVELGNSIHRSNILCSPFSLNASYNKLSTFLTTSQFLPKFLVYQCAYFSLPSYPCISALALICSSVLKNSIERTSTSASGLKDDTWTWAPLVMFRKIPFRKKRNVSMSRYWHIPFTNIHSSIS